jgi:hypothetical protein
MGIGDLVNFMKELVGSMGRILPKSITLEALTTHVNL